MALSEQQIIDAQSLVIDVFKGFRDELLAVFGKIEYKNKEDNSPVTVYDTRVEKTLKDRLAEAFPDLGFEGEEFGKSGSKTTYWLVDPIDGTRSFVRGLPFATNMAALVENGYVVAAVIYDFVNDNLYSALKGKGALKNGEPIHVNTSREAGNLIVYSMGRSGFVHIYEALNELNMRAVLPMTAAGSEFMTFAEGKVDGVIQLYKGKGLHDNAPGVFICEEAGASFLPLDDATGVYRSQFVMGSPLVVELIEHSGLI